MDKITRFWNVNGTRREIHFDPHDRLLDVLRDTLGLTSIKEGCGEGECGTCSFLCNGDVRLACLQAAAQLDDETEIITAEGVAHFSLGHQLEQSFAQHGAVQCGYCTPGLLVESFALLSKTPHPTENEIRTALAGHLCRCTGYKKIVEAISEITKERNP